ncbi:635_t:CDS:2 [Acaulospora morrowiae]|uniref:635_t:CDS:1 n=1 Tax=Acaulospora morrowiae TaxID=94023 RepID=A0A9N9GWA0_9GLOM|nr:635_t:CDS:2 [Acaulospora morrowiae]
MLKIVQGRTTQLGEERGELRQSSENRLSYDGDKEMLSNQRNKNKPSEKTTSNNQNKILEEEHVNEETPAELLDETLRSTCNETR